jgi:Domain of unknown function (DUF4331)
MEKSIDKILGARRMNSIFKKITTLSMILATSMVPIFASSHSEAPLTARDRFADNTDTYAFRSIEKGREDFVTIIANYIPFQQPSGGPHFFRFDDTVMYEIKIDNTGDGVEDIAYQFEFQSKTVNGDTILGQGAVNQDIAITSLDDKDYNEVQTMSVKKVDLKNGSKTTTVASGLIVPPANIGPKVTPNYEENLGSKAVYSLKNGGKVFAGQRDEGFFVDVGGVFDGLNLKSIGMTGGYDYTKGFNVSSVAIELPIKELTRSGKMPKSATADDAVIGIWATASRRSMNVINADGSRKQEGEWRQISRLGNPLVNEVVIPLKLKDAFNSLSPKDDVVAAPAVLDPELPKLMKAVFGINIPAAPRNDLVSIFATGIPVNPITGPNYTTFLSDGKPHEYLRLNTAIPVTPIDKINRLGLLGGDVAGFPNGRRVQDDVVDIALRAVAGGTPFTPETNVAPNNTLGDGVSENDVPFLERFPYLAPPQAGNSPK